MLATAGRPPDPSGLWAVEMKWDGTRAIIVLDGVQARIYSRTGQAVTASFPELAEDLVRVAAGRRCILDGEIVAPDLPTGVPSFGWLQHRMHSPRPSAGLIASIPVQVFVFDVLQLDEIDLMGRAYTARREMLAGLELTSALVLVPPRTGPRSPRRGCSRSRPSTAWKGSCSHGLTLTV
jgi:bifunctional non-homologous end joining protein LigD